MLLVSETYDLTSTYSIAEQIRWTGKEVQSISGTVKLTYKTLEID